jgi:predicted RNA-binding protein with PUA-like domain
MSLWLVKEEPDTYNFADLERDGETAWEGVANALALKHLRAFAVGDRVLYYHTGKEKAIVGEAIVSAAGEAGVRLKPVRRLTKPVTLATVKADESLVTWELARLPRLSVMPVTPEQWARVEELAG